MKKRRMKAGEALVGMKRSGSQLSFVSKLDLRMKKEVVVPPETEHDDGGGFVSEDRVVQGRWSLRRGSMLYKRRPPAGQNYKCTTAIQSLAPKQHWQQVKEGLRCALVLDRE